MTTRAIGGHGLYHSPNQRLTEHRRDAVMYDVRLSMPRLALFAMTKKGAAVLQAIVAQFGADLLSRVVGARDTAVANDHFDEIRRTAQLAGVAHQDRALAAPPSADEVVLAIGWRWLLPAKQLVVIHDSLLPRYRGFAPLVSALVSGEPRIGATALLGGESYDTGPILGQDSVSVSYPLRVADAIDLLVPIYVRLALHIAGVVSRGDRLTGAAQDEALATYSLWRDDDDYRIDWSWPAARIHRFVDAVSVPYRGAASTLDGKLLRIDRVAAHADVAIENRSPGKVIFMNDGVPVVVCGEGLLRLLAIRDDATGESALPLKKFRSRFV